jgi:hypothetical protein
VVHSDIKMDKEKFNALACADDIKKKKKMN